MRASLNRKGTPFSAGLVIVAAVIAAPAAAQERGVDRHPGPVIESFGRHVDLADPDLAIRTDQVFQVAFEVLEPLPSPERVHPRFEAAARLVNMYAHAGVPRENVQVALVLHGGGTRAAMTNAAYRARYDQDNPNLALLEALAEAGVEIYLCEQSRTANRLETSEVAAPVKKTLSAMTALVTLQADGYQFLTY